MSLDELKRMANQDGCRLECEPNLVYVEFPKARAEYARNHSFFCTLPKLIQLDGKDVSFEIRVS